MTHPTHTHISTLPVLSRTAVRSRNADRVKTLRVSSQDSTRGMLPIDQSKHRREGHTSSHRFSAHRYAYVSTLVGRWAEKEVGLSDSTK